MPLIVNSAAPILIPQVTYRTNDSWELVSAVSGDNGWPLLHDSDYLDGQLQVLRLLRTELSGPEIAAELVVSLNTVRTHTKNIFMKLGVTSRRAAVRRADELGL